MRVFLLLIGFGAIVATSIPLVRAANAVPIGPELSPSSPSLEETCRGHMGESSVHCLQRAKVWKA